MKIIIIYTNFCVLIENVLNWNDENRKNVMRFFEYINLRRRVPNGMDYIGYIGVDIQFARLSQEEMHQNRIVPINMYDLPYTDLSAFSGLAITNFTDEQFMVAHQHLFEQYLAKGGVIFSMAEMEKSYLPNAPIWRRSKTPIRDREVIVTKPNYPMFKNITQYDLNYRQGVKGFFTRGYFEPSEVPAHADIIVKDEMDAPLIYVDRESTNGVLIVGAGTDLYQMYRQETPDSSTAHRLTTTIFEAMREEYAHNQQLLAAGNKEQKNFVAKENVVAPTPIVAAPNKSFENKIAILTNGMTFHNRFFAMSEYRDLYDDVIHIEDLHQTDLSQYDTLIVTDRLSIPHLKRNQAKMIQFINEGKRLFIFGEVLDNWFPTIDWKDSVVNFSWWVKPQGDLPLVERNAYHDLYEYVTLKDMKWHYHGTFEPPQGAFSLVDNDEGRSIFYVDNVSFKGELVVTSLDPIFHIGLGFIDQTKPFMAGLTKWLRGREN
jgi:hypothetical protein